MKRVFTVVVFFSYIIVSYSQNLWYTQKENDILNKKFETDCPIYNIDDEEISIEWQYVYGESDSTNLALDITFSPDSNLVFLYKSFALSSYYLVCIKQSGEELWRTKITTNDSLGFGNKITWLDDYIYVSGYWINDNSTHFGIVKLNKNGNKIWFKSIWSNKYNLKRIREFNPYLINVETSYFLGSFIKNDSLAVVKIDSSGNTIWLRSFPEYEFNTNIYVFNVAFDSEYYYAFASTHDTCYYFKIDPSGNIITKSNFQYKHYNSSFMEGDFYFSGYTDYRHPWIRRYSENFMLEMEYQIEDPDGFYNIYDAADIKVLDDKSIAVFYDYNYPADFSGNLQSNFNILHIDSNGNCISTLNLYAQGSQNSRKMLLTNNSDYILFGDGYNQYSNQRMIAIVKVKQWDPLSIDKILVASELNLFPNPIEDKLTIEFNSNQSGNIKIFNINGRMIYSYSFKNEKQLIHDMSDYKSGLYMIVFTCGKVSESRKIIKK